MKPGYYVWALLGNFIGLAILLTVVFLHEYKRQHIPISQVTPPPAEQTAPDQ